MPPKLLPLGDGALVCKPAEHGQMHHPFRTDSGLVERNNSCPHGTDWCKYMKRNH